MASILLSVFVWMIHWGVVLPVAMMIATPYLAVASMTSDDGWRSGMHKGYRAIFRSFSDFWHSGGCGFGP